MAERNGMARLFRFRFREMERPFHSVLQKRKLFLTPTVHTVLVTGTNMGRVPNHVLISNKM